MKIVVAGPFPSNQKSGGVAVFNETLASYYQSLGYEVLKINNIKSIGSAFSNSIEVRRFEPDVIISSLWYSLLFLLFKKNSVTKIHLIHGFTNLRNYNFFKFIGMILIDKIIRRNFETVLGNSSFTKLLNEEIFNVRLDGQFNIGLDQSREFHFNDMSDENKKKILYVGRLVKAKNVDLLISSFMKIDDENLELQIVGYGPEKERLQRIAKTDKRVHFLGSVPNEELSKFYLSADVFVSLNPVEPYGITFLEALSKGMFVIAPRFGGQMDILKKYEGRYALVDVDSSTEIMSTIATAPKRFGELELKIFIEDTAEEILNYARK